MINTDQEITSLYFLILLHCFFNIEIQNNSSTNFENVKEIYLSWGKYLKSIGNKGGHQATVLAHRPANITNNKRNSLHKQFMAS